MPTYIRPARVDITEGGSGMLALLGAGAVLVAAVSALAAFVVAHLLLLAAMVAVLIIGTGTVVAILKRHALVVHNVTPAPRSIAPPAARAFPSPPRAITAPAQHLHLHLHGVSAEDVAAVLREGGAPGALPWEIR